MNQKSLEATIREELLLSLPLGWILPVIAGNQPTGQGRENGIYFFRISDGKNGWQARKYTDQEEHLELTETQWTESQYQFQALVEDDILDDDQLLAADVLSIVRSTLSGIVMVEKLMRKGIGVQRPSDIVTPAFVNDQDQYDYNPNFTISFSHRREITQPVPYTDTVMVKGINRV